MLYVFLAHADDPYHHTSKKDGEYQKGDDRIQAHTHDRFQIG
jgi:hypothetical protein